MRSANFLAYAAIVAAGVDGKPCSRKPSSTVSMVANTTSSVASSSSTSSSYPSMTSSSESITISSSSSFISSTESVPTTSSSLSIPVSTSTASASETTSSFVASSTSSSASITSTSSSVTSSSSSSSSSSTPSSTSSAAQATQTIDVTTYEWTNAILLAHNIHRENHTASDLVWDVSLSTTAAELVMTCNYHHDTTINGGGYGQVIAAGYTGAQVTRMINDKYYQGLANFPEPYGNDNPDLSNFALWGNFAQILWAATERVGCAVQYCPGGLANAPDASAEPYFTVCNYGPYGNVVGEFSNVHEPTGAPSVVFLP